MAKQPKIIVRKTNAGWHPYTATLRGHGAYGFGNTPAEARAKLQELIARFKDEQRQATA